MTHLLLALYSRIFWEVRSYGTAHSYFFYALNCQYIITNGEPDIEPGKGNAIKPIWLSLIGRSGIVTQNTDGSRLLVLRQTVQQFGGEIDLQQKILRCIRKTAGGFRVTIAVGVISLEKQRPLPLRLPWNFRWKRQEVFWKKRDLLYLTAINLILLWSTSSKEETMTFMRSMRHCLPLIRTCLEDKTYDQSNQRCDL